MTVTLGQQYNIGEKLTVILYTYINRHAGTPEKQRRQKSTSSNMVVIIYCYIGCDDKVTSLLSFCCPYMGINVCVQCDGGFLPDIMMLTRCDSIGEPFEYHVEFLSLQPMFPPKSFD